MNNPRRVVDDLRRRAVDRLVKQSGLTGHDALRIRGYCDISYRMGYRVARQRANAVQCEQRKRREAFVLKNRPIYVCIETDAPMECPICGVEIAPKEKHEHDFKVKP
jgi:hypothetical protein